ncbi:unnamed protein product [Ascophyllum nodosum]
MERLRDKPNSPSPREPFQDDSFTMKRPATTVLVLIAFSLQHQRQVCDAFRSARPTTGFRRCGGGTMRSFRRRTPAATTCMVSTVASPAVDLSGDGGVTREMLQEGKGKGLATGDIAMVRFTGVVEETGQVFSKGDQYRTTLEDGTMISGWDTGLAGLRPGDRAKIRCSSRYGYGDEGVSPVIPPDSTLVFDVELLENEGNIMNPATFVDSNPLIPRTPDTIAEAFDFRSRQKMMALDAKGEGELEGLDKAVAWLKSIYIFGLFGGETGQEAPWYLKPAITFPIMISICGAAFTWWWYWRRYDGPGTGFFRMTLAFIPWGGVSRQAGQALS